MRAGDLEAERIVVAHYLVRRAADLRDSTVRPEHFVHLQHRNWWEAAMRCVFGSVGADPADPRIGAAQPGWTASDLKVPAEDQALLAGIRATPEQVRAAERRMIRRWQLTATQLRCGTLAEQIRKGEIDDADSALSAVRSALHEIESGGAVEAKTHREVGLDLFREWADSLRTGKSHVIAAPLETLARHITGWQKKKLYLVGAVTSGHKTTFGRHAAWHAAKNGDRRVLYWTMEDSADEIAARTIAAEVRQVDTRTFTAFQRPDVPDGDFARLVREVGAHLDHPGSQRLLYLDEGMPRLSRVMSQISAVAAKGLRLVVLDFLQLIQPDNPDTPENTHWFNVGNHLAALAKRLDLPVIACVQPTQLATREAARQQRPVTIGDIRGGSSIAQSAYGVILLQRVYVEGEIDRRVLEVEIVKWKNADLAKWRIGVYRNKDLLVDE